MRRLAFAVCVLLPWLVSSSASAEHSKSPPFNFEIRTLSNRADLISDGDALVEVQVPKNVPMKKVTLTLNGADVGAAFVADERARTFRGVLTGMVLGRTCSSPMPTANGHGRPWASLTITNHPRGGPVLLGSQTTPWICATPTPVAAVGQHAGVERERPVDLRGRRAVQHRDRVQAVLPHDDAPAARPRCPTRARRPRRRRTTASSPTRVGSTPADLAMTTTTTGLTVPYIVRVERGTINRGIYDIAVLFDPTQAVDGARAAGAVERQGGLHLRRLDRPAAAAVPHRAELGRRRGAVARLHGRRQQPHRLALQLEPRRWSPRR